MVFDRAFRTALFATCVCLAILISLGVWQLHRLAWKQNLLAQIDRALAAPPVPLGATPPNWARVTAHGVLQPQYAYYGFQGHDLPGGRAQVGAQVLRVLRRAGQPPLLVDLGWLPQGAAPPPVGPAPVTITGFVRGAEQPGWLSAADDPASRHFYTLNPASIGAAIGAPDAAPFTLIALGPQAALDAPIPADGLPRPPNNHLQYAFTWFGLAAALLGVFFCWAFGRHLPTIVFPAPTQPTPNK